MATVQISLSENVKAYADAAVGRGGFPDLSNYVSTLIRDDEAKLAALRAALQEGIDSGICDQSLEEIFEEIDADIERRCA